MGARAGPGAWRIRRRPRRGALDGAPSDGTGTPDGTGACAQADPGSSTGVVCPVHAAVATSHLGHATHRRRGDGNGHVATLRFVAARAWLGAGLPAGPGAAI